MKVAFDTNVLVYAAGVGDEESRDVALDLVARLPPTATHVATQVLAELYRVLVHKGRYAAEDAETIVTGYRDSANVLPITADTFFAGVSLSTRHRLQIFDSIILAAAAEAECGVLLTEDMQHGAVYAGVTIVNPFAHPNHPLLTAALRADPA